MQLRYVFSETSTGLRRNLSMSIALVVTIFVSLTLVGMAFLLNAQAQKAQDVWGSKLQITVFLCNQNSQGPQCASGNATPAQQTAIKQVLKANPEVASYYFRTKQQAFSTWKKIYVSKDPSERAIYSAVKPSDMQESYWVTLRNPNQYLQVEQAVKGMDGVDHILDLRSVLKPIYDWMSAFKWGAIGIAAFLLLAAILQVGNTIRLAAFARRREIGIMRLVGASSLYITLPFLIETLVAALVGVLMSAGAIAVFVQLVVYDRLRANSTIMEWIDWVDAGKAIFWIAVLGTALAVLPTLVLTRKYLKV